MNDLRPLYELQKIDLGLDGRKDRLSEIDRALGNESPLMEFRSRVSELTRFTTHIKSQQRELEDSIDGLSHRISSSDQKLYSGNVTNPRELEDLQAEIALLARNRGDFEDRLISSLEELSPVEDALTEARNALASAENSWADQQKLIAVEKDQLEDEIRTLNLERNIKAEGISNLILPLYESVRIGHSGRAVALVQNGICDFCRVALPTAKIQSLRAATKPERCPNCGLILVVE